MNARVFVATDLHRTHELVQNLSKWMTGLRLAGTAATEIEAKIWLERNAHWDAAIVDLILDEGSGLKVIEHAKKTPHAGKVAVISSYLTPAVRAHCLALGADIVFDKRDMVSLVVWLDELCSERSGATNANQVPI